MIEACDITGLVLAGGRGSRMGGVEKGLQPYAGRPLAWHALQRLAPQVGPLLISANRCRADYAALGAPVCADTDPDRPGPLAGFLAGLRSCTTPWLASVPCDAPNFPLDLVARLAAALHGADAEVAIAATRGTDGAWRPEPVFCLMRADLADSVAASLRHGQRRVERWAANRRCVRVPFDEADAFMNLNSLDELSRSETAKTAAPRGNPLNKSD